MVLLGLGAQSLVTSGAQNDYPCRVAEARATDPQLLDDAATTELFERRLYPGQSFFGNRTLIESAEQLRAGHVGEPVSSGQSARVVTVDVQPPRERSKIDQYALVDVDGNSESPDLGYIVDYGKHQAIDEGEPERTGIVLVRTCAIAGRSVTVIAGHLSAKYSVRVLPSR